jgi:acetyl esterase/lipase
MPPLRGRRNVDYRRAPRAQYPVAVLDAFAATSWIARQGARLGVDARRLAVGGDSAAATSPPLSA